MKPIPIYVAQNWKIYEQETQDATKNATWGQNRVTTG